MRQLCLDVAAYVLTLEDCSGSTHRAEDRSQYGRLLADAASLLASVVQDTAAEESRRRFDRHERLRGQTWLADPAYRAADEKWATVRGHFGNAAV
jgi:hypothetical protein